MIWKITAIFLFLATMPAAAHESRPFFIEITERESAVSLRSVAPQSVEAANAPSVFLDAPCALVAEQRRGVRMIEAEYRCETLEGVSLKIDWPAFNPSLTTIVRAQFSEGGARTAILKPDETSWPLPAPQSFAGVARSYFLIGAEHILLGADHLLFLAGLLFIAGTFRRAVVTATGFTIAHSLTLALVALDVVRLSIPAIEAVIALSIVFLAAEIARGDRMTIAWRRPAIVASAFGLFHGAGFAAALSEIGLPAGEKTAALLFFNLGVEAGQLAVVFACFAAVIALRGVTNRAMLDWNSQRPTQVTFGYALGAVSAMWLAQRAAAIFAA